MSFYTRGTMSATGKKEDAFKSVLIPHNTWVMAKITDFKLRAKPWDPTDFSYQLTWQVVQGPYTNKKIFQDLRCFDKDDMVAIDALNKLLYLAQIFGIWLPEDAQPQNNDLLPFINKIADIKVTQPKPREDKPNAKINNYVGIFEEHDPLRFGDNPQSVNETNNFVDDEIPY